VEKYRIIIGIVARVSPVINNGTCRAYFDANCVKPPIRVLIFAFCINTNAMRSSFHTQIEFTVANVAIAGFESGMKIFIRILKDEAPSIIALSCIDEGIVLKNPSNVYMEKGSNIPVYIKITL
jgi:hypothetical protein